MSRIIITGGTGMIGGALTTELLKQGHEVIIFTRKKPAAGSPGISYAEWDPRQGKIDEEAIAAADHVIHLAGANVADGRWTSKRKQEIRDSRVLSGQLLVKAIAAVPNHIQSVVSASAIGWYGPDRDSGHSFVETDPAYHDFLGATCSEWEDAISGVQAKGKRLVILRTGIVLGREGGAYREFAKPLKFRVAPVLGSGKQVVSWIHMEDLVRLYITAVSDESFSGIYNAVAPHPVSNRELMMAIARSKARFFIPAPVPAFALKIMLGEMSIEVLKSATVSSGKLVHKGFKFQFDTIEKAAENLAHY